MTTQIRIIKKDVLKALKKDELAPGLWVRHLEVGRSFDAGIPTTCRVCAVGSVIRQAWRRDLKSKLTPRHLEKLCQSACHGFEGGASQSDGMDVYLRALVKREYIGALNKYFEFISFGRSRAQAKKLTMAFVEAHFPDEFMVNV